MQERRRSTRLGSWLHAAYAVPGASDQPSNAIVRTTSEGGVSLFTDRALAPGTLVRVEVHRPPQRPVTFTAEARWSQPLLLASAPQVPRAYEVGMEFHEIAPEDRKAIMLYTVLSPPTTTV
jgi:hypothetical protein